MVNSNSLMDAAKDIGKFVLITFSTYFVAIVVHIILGYLEETVVPALGLNATGTAVTAINGLITSIGTAINTLVGIVTVVVGLLTLMVVLKAFNFKLNFNVGGGRV